MNYTSEMFSDRAKTMCTGMAQQCFSVYDSVYRSQIVAKH